MKNILLLLQCLIICLFTFSCSTVRTTTSKSMDIYGSGVIQKPVVVDLIVSEDKVTGSATEVQSRTLESVKQKAVVDAIKKSGADVLVEPAFETETKKGKTTATVTGFPGTYKNFRPIEQADFPLLEAGVLQKAEVYIPSAEVQKKSSAAAIIASVLILGIAGAIAAAGVY